MEVGERLRARLTSPFALLFGLYLALGVGMVIPRMTADGIAYYAETRSVILDGDLDLADEYAFDSAIYSPLSVPGPRRFLPRDLDGGFEHYANIGIVILFGPFFLIGHAAAWLATAVGRPISMDGYDVPYVLAIAFGTGAMVAAGLVALATYARRRVGTVAATVGAAAIWLGSPLLYWSAFRPAHAHAPAVLLEAAFVTLFLTRARHPGDRLAWLGLGVIGGLMLTVRPVTGLYSVVPAGWLIFLVVRCVVTDLRAQGSLGGGRVRAAVGRFSGPMVAALLFLAGTFVGRLPQFVFARDFSLAGSSFYSESGYLTKGFGGDPIGGLVSLTLDPQQGILWWAPLVPLSLVGLLAYWRRDRLTTIACFVWAASIWTFIALLDVPERFGGLALPSRHLVEATPVYVLGAAGLPAVIGAVARRLRSGLQRPTVVLTYLAMVTASTYTVLALVAGTVSRVGSLGPADRVLQVLGHPTMLGRLFVAPGSFDVSDGKVFIGGRLLSLLLGAHREVFREFLMGVGVLGITALVGVLVAVGLARATRRGPPRERGVAALAAGICWALVVTLIAGLSAPAFARPTVVIDGQRLSRVTWTPDQPGAASGQLSELRIGDSPQGNAVLDPPPADRGMPAGLLESLATVPLSDLATERRATLAIPNTWDVLDGVAIRVGVTPDINARLEFSVFRTGDDEPAVVRTVAASSLRDGVVVVSLPLRTTDLDGPIEVVVRAPAGHQAPSVGTSSDGALAAIPIGRAGKRPPDVRLDGRSLLVGSWLEAGSPQAASVVLRPGGFARARIGPWSAEVLLRWAVDGAGWNIPGPTLVEGTWSDSIVRPVGVGRPLVVRVDMPLPIRSATAHVLVTAFDVHDPGSVRIDGSVDGVVWQELVTMVPEEPGRLESVEATLAPAAATTSVWFRLDAQSNQAATGINGAWFDALLDPSNDLVGSIGAGRLSVVPLDPADTPAAVEVDSATLPSQVDAILLGVGAGATATLDALGPGVALLLALVLALMAAAAALTRRRLLGGGALALAAILTTNGLIGLPRTSVLPRTRAYGEGSVENAVVIGETVLVQANGSYVTPTVYLTPGSLVVAVEAIATGSRPVLEIRTVASDATTGEWRPSDQELDIGSNAGIQVRASFAGESRLFRVIVRSLPPTAR